MLNGRRKLNAEVTTTEPRPMCELLSEEMFSRMLCLERKRTERNGRRFVLMLLELNLTGNKAPQVVPEIVSALSRTIRETDLKGWYKAHSTLGIVFTEVGSSDGKQIARALLSRVGEALRESVDIEDIRQISISFHLFPDDWEKNPGSNETLYPDLVEEKARKRFPRVLKRSLDIFGSLLLLTVLSPLLLLIAAAVKLTSRGPALFRQKRLGRYGRPFTFLKFRSMYITCDAAVHQDYIQQFIAGNVPTPSAGKAGTVYKLVNDRRITPFGRFLRRSSLDELPQLINVLRGDMSLVGPRPPIPYEFQEYRTWHKRRLLAVQPGLTGLWQVAGRSRTTFDEMVRMDIRYAASWSLWLDFKILLQTPRAVLSGEGAR